MLSTFTYEPYSQQPDLKTDIHRTDVERWVKFSERGQLRPIRDITIVRESTAQEQERRCFDYAINQVIDDIPPLMMYKKQNKQNKQKSTITIEKYFEPTLAPHNKDLVLYTDNKNSYIINHAASVFDKDNNTFESIFGSSKKIVHHQPFAVPLSYGKTYSYWTLKQEYKDNKENLRKTIRNDAEAFDNDEPSYKKIKYSSLL